MWEVNRKPKAISQSSEVKKKKKKEGKDFHVYLPVLTVVSNMNTTIYPCSERQHLKVSMRYSEMPGWIILPCSYSTCLQVTQLSFSEMSQMFHVKLNGPQPNHKCQGRGGGYIHLVCRQSFWKWRLFEVFLLISFYFFFLNLNFPTTVFVVFRLLFKEKLKEILETTAKRAQTPPSAKCFYVHSHDKRGVSVKKVGAEREYEEFRVEML